MNYKHKVSIEWMEARKKYLTASSIHSLVSSKNQFDAMISILAEKQAEVTEEMCISYGAAARGHVLEPYAIECRNNECALIDTDEVIIYHHDDVLITDGILAYSPDGLDIPQTIPDVDISNKDISPNVVSEYKCYAPVNHYKCGTSDKMKLSERWQLVTAMAVSESIILGELVFFNPDVNHKLFRHVYDRDELDEDIQKIREIRANAIVSIPQIIDMFNNARFDSLIVDTNSITRRIMQSQQLDNNRSILWV